MRNQKYSKKAGFGGLYYIPFLNEADVLAVCTKEYAER